MPQTAAIRNYLAIDFGEARLGIAIANSIARLVSPRPAIGSEQVLENLEKLCQAEKIDAIVVGLPRGIEGQETEQTGVVRAFVQELQERMPNIPVYLQDEALTSVQAEKELATRGKQFTKGEIDSLAATYILEDFLMEHREES